MDRVLAFASRRPVIATIWLVAALGAAVQVARLSVFMFDPYRASASVLPTNPFFREHTCLSGFVEAARYARQGASTSTIRGSIWLTAVKTC